MLTEKQHEVEKLDSSCVNLFVIVAGFHMFEIFNFLHQYYFDTSKIILRS